MALKTWTGVCMMAAVLAACGKKEAPAVPAPVAAPVPVPAPVQVPAPAKAPPPAPAASSDPDAPTALPALQVKGAGLGKSVSYYYAFKAGAGTIIITATAKNAPSGATQALQFALYDAKSTRLCFDAHGNTNSDKTVVLKCSSDKDQPLTLRLDLGEETIDYTVALEGPVTLLPPEAPGAARPVAGAGSTDIDAPTRLETNRIKGAGSKQAVSYFYAFNAGPGELLLTGDGRNLPAATTDALTFGLYTLRSEKLCEHSLGNTTLDKRAVIGCQLDRRQPVILRLDLREESLDFRVKFDGPYDFDPYTAPKEVTIALDAAVLFDSGKAELKAEAQRVLHEAAERVKKFKGASVLIAGHTDNVGKEAANKLLSDQRAAAVRDHFTGKEGVAAAGLSVKGYGKSQPVADNGQEAGRARNRRVDVLIKPAAP